MMQSLLLAGGGAGGLTMISTLSGLGLTSGLQVCVDAGDFESYIGSGQSWLDRSPNGNYFFLGNSGGSLNDPVFSGPAAYPAAYFAVTATGNFFSYFTASATFFDSMHKDGAIYSAAILFYHTGVSSYWFWGDAAADTGETGTQLGFVGPNKLKLSVTVTASTTLAMGAIATFTPSSGAWHMLGVSVSEPGATGFFYLDGAFLPVSGSNTFVATYSGPSAGAAAQFFSVFARGQNNTTTPSQGGKISFLSMWNVALTKANFDSIWALLRSRFNL